MEDFIIFDPTTHQDFAANKIAKLNRRNALLTVCLLIAASAMVYLAYQNYQLQHEILL